MIEDALDSGFTSFRSPTWRKLFKGSSEVVGIEYATTYGALSLHLQQQYEILLDVVSTP